MDLVAIPGLPAGTGQTLVAAVGTAMTKGPREKEGWAWLTRAPDHAISGGNVRRRGTRKTRNRAGQACRLAAHAVSRSHRSRGAYDRRLRARLGPQAALVATAHTRARIVAHMRTHRTPYRDLSPEDDEQRAQARELANLRNKAVKLGLTLVESLA